MSGFPYDLCTYAGVFIQILLSTVRAYVHLHPFHFGFLFWEMTEYRNWSKNKKEIVKMPGGFAPWTAFLFVLVMT